LLVITTQAEILLSHDTTNGSLDSTFGVAGKATTGFTNSTDEARGLALQPDSQIVVTGSAFNGTTLADFALARFNSELFIVFSWQ
jgi:hypothetical protein